MIDYFNNFQKYAFRLELLQKYTVEEEKEILDHFLKTGKLKKKEMGEWYKIITNAIDRGAIMERVHVIKKPLTDYIRFEMESYKLTTKNGEKVFLLSQEEFDKIKSPINSDFWLFDDKIVLKMSYNEEGRFLGFKEVKKNLEEFIELKKKLLMLGEPIKWENQ